MCCAIRIILLSILEQSLLLEWPYLWDIRALGLEAIPQVTLKAIHQLVLPQVAAHAYTVTYLVPDQVDSPRHPKLHMGLTWFGTEAWPGVNPSPSRRGVVTAADHLGVMITLASCHLRELRTQSSGWWQMSTIPFSWTSVPSPPKSPPVPQPSP